MPLYEYRCGNCGLSVETLERASASSSTSAAPSCSRCGTSMQRLFSTFAPRGDRSVSATQGVCQHKYGCTCGRK